MRTAMRRAVAGVLFLAATLAGCADSHVASSMFYLEPHRLEDLDCAEVAKRLANANERVSEAGDLKAKAETAPEGSFIGAMVYGPDYSRARWDQRIYQEEATRRNCAPAPLATTAGPAPPSGPLQLPPPPPRR